MHPELALSEPTEELADAESDGTTGAETCAPSDDTALDPLDPLDPVVPTDDAADEPDHLSRIEDALTAIAREMALATERAEFRERVIDRLHADVERLRATERTGLLRPVVTDLCRLRNDLLRQADTLPVELTRARVVTLLGSFADVVENALERCGVAVLDAAEGAAFLPGRHQVVDTVAVDDAALDSTVAGVLQDGYVEMDGGKVVVPARITVRRAVGRPPSTDTDTDTDTDTTTGTEEQTDE